MMDWEIEWVEDIKAIESEELARQDRLNTLRGKTCGCGHGLEPDSQSQERAVKAAALAVETARVMQHRAIINAQEKK